ncbi:hypothetical protein [Parasulfitobacter algicola]|uniref:DUF4352 domain-containing protein n=1 Tax=Parasulfitobacter algicola TaxID=2614809 RepID=A0ABX2ITY8_9RHOB|nr:hypothetical protein [Sulfitobacter algicola]NSX53829.1 hypothetical protein [Sulfitobacter algicola]
MQIKVNVDVPRQVNGHSINPENPEYSGAFHYVRLVFANTGNTTVEFPAQAIVQQVLRRYKNNDTGDSQDFYINEPPFDTFQSVKLQSGETWTYGLGFEYPDTFFRKNEKPNSLLICAIWDKKSLNTEIYPPGSYDWAESFEACEEVSLVYK